MKKLTKILVVIFIVSVLALTFSACKKDCKGNHQLEATARTVTCTEAGDIAYWTCTACNKLFRDANGVEEISESDLHSEALGHSFQKADGSLDTSKLVAAVSNSCTGGGNVAYYSCTTCQHYFTAEGSTLTDKGTNLSALQTPATGHSFQKADGTLDTSKLVAAASANCEDDGNLAYYLCENCNHYFTVENDALTDKGADISAVTLPATGHSFVKADGTLDTSKLVAEKDPTCTKAGNVAYYLCETCEHYFTVEDDELTDNGDDVSEVTLPATGHSFVKADGSLDTDKLVEESAPLCLTPGNVAYYLCENCEHYFTVENDDSLADHGIDNSDLVIAAIGHKWGSWVPVANSNPEQHKHECNNCDAEETKPCSKGENAELSGDATGHWYPCTLCKAHLEFVSHEVNALGCAICGWVSQDAVAMLTIGEQTTYYASGDAVNTAILALFPAEGLPEQPINAQVKLLKDAEADHIGALYGAGMVSNMTLVIDLDGHKFTLAKSTQFGDGTFTLKNGVIECTAGAGKPAIQVTAGATVGLEALEVKAAGSIAVAVLGGTVNLRSTDKLEGETALYMMYTGAEAATKVYMRSGAEVDFAGAIEYGYMPDIALADGWNQKLLFVVGGSEKTLSEGELEKLSSENPTNTYTTYEAFLSVLVGEDHVHTPVAGSWATNGDANYHYAICECETIIADLEHRAQHTWSDAPNHKDNKAATCTATGVKVQICNACGQIKKITLPALNHSWGEWSIDVTATCTVAGHQTRECGRCHEPEEEVIPKLNHNYVANVCSRGDSTLTQAQVLEKLFDSEGKAILTTGQSLTGTYKLTGVIKSIDLPYTAQNNYINATITVDGKDIYCFHLKGGSELAEGYTITVTGKIEFVSSKTRFAESSTYVRVWTDAEKVAADKAALTLGKNYDDNFTLRTKGTAQNSTITWALKNTADSAYVTVGTDSVTLKGPFGAGVHHEIVLVATITSGSVSDTKEFTINVADSWEEFAVTYTAPQHATMIVESAEGAVASGDTVISGETVTVSLTLEDGYKLASYTVNGTKTTAANATSFEITVTAATTFSVEVVEKYTAKTLTEFYALADGTEGIKVTGTITGINGRNVYIQDESGKALLVYASSSTLDAGYVVGNKITVAGKVTVYSGLYELVPIELISSVAATPIAATSLDETAVGALGAGDASKLITINGLVFQSVTSGNYKFKKGDTEITLRPTNNSAAAKILAQLQANDTINAVGVFVGYYNGVQINLYKASQVQVQWTLAASAANNKVAVNSTVKVNVTTTPSFVLNGIKEGETTILAGLGAITYTSSNPAVATVSYTGIVTGVTPGDVTISVSVGGKTATTQQITVEANVVSKNATFTFDGSVCVVSAELSGEYTALDDTTKIVTVAQNNTIDFKVVPNSGYVLKSVKVGSEDVPCASGVYTVTVSDNMEIVIVVEAKAGWALVDNVDELQANDQIVIVGAKDGVYYALSTNDKGNNRGAVAVTIENGILQINPDVQIITLEAITDSESFKLSVGNSLYLNAPGGTSNNYLKSTVYPSAEADQAKFNWTISVANGSTTIRANIIDSPSSTQRGDLLFNYNGGNPMFAAYKISTTGTAVSVYKLYPCTTHSADEWQNDATNHWKVCSACGTTFVTHSNSGYACAEDGCTWTAQTKGLTINATGGVAGTDFTLTYTSGVTENQGYVGYEVKFTITGVASGKTASVSLTDEGGNTVKFALNEGVYSFTMPNSTVAINVILSDAGDPQTVIMTSFSAVSGNLVNTETGVTDSNISYAATQGNAGTAPAVNGVLIRIYQNGGLLTITANNDKKITSIKVGTDMSTTLEYTVDGGTAVPGNSVARGGKLEVDNLNATTIVIKCTGTTSSTRLYLNYLEVVYE